MLCIIQERWLYEKGCQLGLELGLGLGLTKKR